MRIFTKHLLVLLCVCGGLATASAQHLQRRAFLGFQPLPPSDSVQKAHTLTPGQGFLVASIRPGGTLEGLGVQKGDVLLKVNTTAMGETTDFQALMRDVTEGQPISVEISKAGKRRTLSGKAVGLPKEQSTSRYQVTYGEAPFQNGWLRTIVRKPLTPGKHPVIYFIPGYTCASVDNPSPVSPYSRLFDSLANLGYALYRIEKPGVGDGPHPCQCEATGFDLELEVFATGYKDLLTKDFVDPNKIFLFGHSMGGFQAPLMTALPGIKPRGIAVYGTAFQSWYEYIIAMLRFQEPRNGEDYRTFEQDMQTYTRLFYAHYVEMKSLDEILKNPAWKALLVRDFELSDKGDLLWRRWFYWQELAKRNVTEAWLNTDAKVLSIYGTADFEVFNPFSMEEIARIVNSTHPGNGRFVALEGADHGMIDVGSMDGGLALRGTPAYRDRMIQHFDFRIVNEVDRWIKEVLALGK